MSKLEELIQELCPNGVEYKYLQDVCTFKRGSSLTSKDAKDGNIPVISGGQKPAFYHNAANRTGKTIVIAGSGAYAGYVSFWQQPIFCADSFSVDVQDNTVLNIKYLYHYLRNNQKAIYNKKTGAGIPHVHGKDIARFRIPVPPLPVQEEIVRILDNFTELATELATELTARKKQYEYYRAEFLALNTVSKVRIGSICDVFTGGEPPADCVKRNTPDEAHPYAVWGNGKEIYGYSSTYKIDRDAVVISSIGANTGAVYFRKALFTPIIRLKVLVPKNESLDIRYLYHAMSATKIESKSSSVPNMNAAEIKAIEIPLPDTAVQKKIAAILDRFDALCNDLSTGLPAEIEARKKQYEYYRDKLLSFKELGA